MPSLAGGPPPGPDGSARVFATTHWTVVLAASRPDSPEQSAALEQLCRTYWYPIYAFIRRRGVLPADAEDLTQEFFARLLAKEWLLGVEENGGRFRSFLLTAVSRFLANQHDRNTAAKRGGGAPLLDLDAAEGRFEAETQETGTAERSYDRHWAIALLEKALARLQEEARENARNAAFEQLSPFLSREPEPGEYEIVAARLKMSVGALGIAVFRLRRRYRDVVRSLIAETVADPADVDSELRHLADVLRS